VTDLTVPDAQCWQLVESASRKLRKPSPGEGRELLNHHELGSRLLAAVDAERDAVRRLKAKVTEAELDFLHDLARRYENRELSQRDLARIYIGLRSLGRGGMATRWDEVLPFKRIMIEHERFNEPHSDGNWYGVWPIPRGVSVPQPGQAVVYYLFDGEDICCYIGSSGDLRQRLKWHKSDGKIFERWEAEPFASRAAAYEAEDELLRLLSALPRYNAKAAR
jgi:hypothetical protein